MTTGQPDPADRPATPSRGRPFSSILLFAAAGGLLLLAAIQGAGYAAVALATSNSGLAPWFQRAFRTLWIGNALQLALIAAILAVAAWKPGSLSKAATILCGLLPLPTGLLLANADGSVAATVAYLGVALVTVAGALFTSRPAAAAPPAREVRSTP